jgi:hypothetical protein
VRREVLKTLGQGQLLVGGLRCQSKGQSINRSIRPEMSNEITKRPMDNKNGSSDAPCLQGHEREPGRQPFLTIEKSRQFLDGRQGEDHAERQCPGKTALDLLCQTKRLERVTSALEKIVRHPN